MVTAPKHKNKFLYQGKNIAVGACVMEVCLENNLPPIYTLLHTGNDKEMSDDVLNRLEAHRSGISLKPTGRIALSVQVEKIRERTFNSRDFSNGHKSHRCIDTFRA